LAKANYPHAKRQRDLRKKQKREEKRLRKLAKKGIDPTAEAESPPDAQTGSAE
jgi:hypothetical protein